MLVKLQCLSRCTYCTLFRCSIVNSSVSIVGGQVPSLSASSGPVLLACISAIAGHFPLRSSHFRVLPVDVEAALFRVLLVDCFTQSSDKDNGDATEGDGGLNYRNSPRNPTGWLTATLCPVGCHFHGKFLHWVVWIQVFLPITLTAVGVVRSTWNVPDQPGWCQCFVQVFYHDPIPWFEAVELLWEGLRQGST